MNSSATEYEMKFIADVEQAMAAIKKMEGAVNASLSAIAKAAKVVAGALAAVGVAVSISAFAGWVREAINAADAASKMAQKIGIATKDVAGLQLAFKMAGVESGAMQTAMSKLSSGVTNGNRVLDALGVKAKTATGAFRDSKDVLYEVADRFSELKDGAAKTAAAVELFGRAGADMLPLLNGGSEGLREMADMAEKLGLVVSDSTGAAAEQFNDTLDLIKLSGQGVATQLAAQLLPTLNSLTGAFFESLTQGNTLTEAADALATSLKLLYTTGAITARVFGALGKTIGAGAAQLVAVLHGDVKGAQAIGREWLWDMVEDTTATTKNIARAWSNSGDATVAALASTAKRTKEIHLQTDRERAGADKAAADALAAQVARVKAADKAVLDARKSHFEDIALLVKLGKKTEVEAIEAQLAEEARVFDERTALMHQELALLKSKANSLKDQEGVLGRLAEIERAYADAKRKASADMALLDKKEADAIEARYQAAKKDSESAESGVREQKRRAQVLGLEYAHAAKGAGASNSELAESLSALERSWAYETAAQLERRAELERGRDLSGETTAELLRQAEAVRGLADLKFDAAMTQDSMGTLKAIDAYLDPAKAKDFGTALRDSFGEAGNALAQMANALQDFGQKQAELAELQKALAADKNISAADRYEREMQLAKASIQLQVSGYASIVGAAKGLFKEHSKGYKAMQTVEKAFRAFEIVMAAQSMAKQIAGIVGVSTATQVAEQVKSAAVTQGVGVQLAADQVKGQSAAAVGVATQAQGDPYSAWARMAAMVAVMAGLGFAVRGGGAAGGGDAYSKPVAGTGTVLGAEGEQSKSIGNAIELLAANSRIELPLTQQMLMQLRGVRDGIQGLSAIVARDPNLRGVNSNAFNYSGKTEMLDSGIMFNPGQTVGSIIDQGIRGLGFTLLKDKGKGAYVIPSELQSELKGQMNSIVVGMVGSIANAAQTLGLDDAGMLDRIRAVMPSLGDTTEVLRQTGQAGGGILSLEGLSGKDAAAQLEAMFSSMGDQIAQAAMPSLAAFQQVGEGMFETVMRVASSVEKANYALEQFGIEAVHYTDVVNKSGDLATEIVRQSVTNLERTVDGGLTGVGRILDLFTGSYDELIDLYQVLTDVRGAMRSVNIEGMDLSAMMIRGAGGLDKLQGGLQEYFDAFFSEEEQAAANAARLAEDFARIGIAVPASKDAFRELVESLDTSTDAGALLFGQLMALAGQFAGVADAAEAAADAQADSVRSAARAAADAWRAVAASLRNDLERMRAETESLVDPALRYARGLAQLDREVGDALAGDIDAAKRVGASAVSFLQASERNSATRAEYLRDRALTAAKLAAVAEGAEEQASIQQVIADMGAKQILELQAINANLIEFARALVASSGVTVPAFASGGMHAGGLRLVGERGWEIEATGASRIWNQDQIAAALGDSDVDGERFWRRTTSSGQGGQSSERRIVELLESLLEEAIQGNEDGRSGDASIAEIEMRIFRILDRLSDGGEAMRTREVEDLDEPSPRLRPRRVPA